MVKDGKSYLEGFQVILNFSLKINVLGHSASIDMLIEKLLKKTYFFCWLGVRKNEFSPTGPGLESYGPG